MSILDPSEGVRVPPEPTWNTLEMARVFDLQCPPMHPDKYVDRGAWMAHSWWNTVLGSVLARVEEREPDRPGLCGEHHWLDRPESDTRECLICGTEVAG